jgi:hypothetical protein
MADVDDLDCDFVLDALAKIHRAGKKRSARNTWRLPRLIHEALQGLAMLIRLRLTHLSCEDLIGHPSVDLFEFKFIFHLISVVEYLRAKTGRDTKTTKIDASSSLYPDGELKLGSKLKPC